MAISPSNLDTAGSSNNLISSSEIDRDCSVINLSKQKGNWIKNSNNVFQQASETGTRKQGSGSILLWNKFLSNNQLELSGNPGTAGQFGIVFNYSNPSEFNLFFLDQHSLQYTGHHLVVGAVREGRFQVMNKDKFDPEINSEVKLRIETSDGNTRYLIDQRVVYESDELVLLTGRGFGLYSQGKNNGEFRLFGQDGLDINPDTGRIDIPITDIDSANNQVPSKNDTMDESTSRLQSYLTLQEPKAKTLINFTEVFTVPLDSFYERLYKNPKLNDISIPGILSEVESQVYKLDFRPRRWYTDYKKVTEIEGFLEVDLNALKGRVQMIEDQLSQATDDDSFEKLRTRLSSYRADYGDRLEQLNIVREQKSQLLREVRTNGFTIIEDKTPQTILDKGYNFYLIGGQPTERTLTPVPIPYQFDYSKDDQWKELQAKLATKLLDSSALSTTQKIKFSEQVAQLVDFVSNVKLQTNIAAIDSEIAQLKDQQTKLPSTAAIGLEKSAWQKDKDMLLTEMAKNPMDYYASDYPIQVDGHDYMPVGITDSTKFTNWLYNGSVKGGYQAHPAMSNYNLLPAPYNFKKFARLVVSIGCAYGIVSPYNAGLFQPFVGINYPEASVFYHRFFASTADQRWTVPATPEVPSGRGIPGSPGTPAQGPYTVFNYQWGGDRSIGNFFREAMKVCDYYIAQSNSQITIADQTRNKNQNDIAIKQDAKQAIIDNGLPSERKDFLAYWNNPEAINVKTITTNIISPDVDPLADLLINLSGNETDAVNYKTYFFQFNGDGFYNQEGQSLKEFSLSSAFSAREVLAVVPEFDKNGKVSPEVVNAITNPKPVTSLRPDLPIIKFTETYEIQVKWTGYGLGELSQSFNLFPGETKELIIDKATRQQTQSSQTTTSSQETSKTTSNSFEENLNSEFSDQSSDSASDTTKTVDSTVTGNSTQDVSGGAKEFNLKLSAPGGISPSLGLTDKSDWRNTKNSALEKTQSTDTQKINNQSRDILQKNVNNTINKVASQTSMNNKLEVTTSTSYEYEETSSRKETIKIQNPNIGRTINYNLFQLQNVYEISIRLTDVKIVINPAIEVMQGSGMSDIRVFELEEFGKIFVNLDQQDPHSALLSAIVARQVFKHYADMMPGITTGNGAVKVKGAELPDPTMIQELNFSGSADDPEYVSSLNQRLQTALAQLQQIPFVFNEVPMGESSFVTVNAAAYYLESELGERPSTEKYLESRRDIETEMQLAGLDHLRAQTKLGVFYPNFSNVKRLTIDSLDQAGKNGKTPVDQ